MKRILKFTTYIFVLCFCMAICVCASEHYTKVGLFYSGSALSSGTVAQSRDGFEILDYDEQTHESRVTDEFKKSKIQIHVGSKNSIYITANGSNDVLWKSSSDTVYLTGYETGFFIGNYEYYGILKVSVDSNKKLKVINIIETEQYLKGVVPSEVYTTWHPEALKTAAIAARTFVLKSIGGKHSSLGFDVCATTCCQVYSGFSKAVESTNAAVDDTRGEVVTYNGELATTVYHAISGGITESAAGAWGGNPDTYPYLTVVKTPFEQYQTLNRGAWTVFISPDELLDYINTSTSKKGVLTGNISDISYETDGGEYLHRMTISDDEGNEINLSTSSAIRSLFTKFVYSANFTIAPTLMPSNEPRNDIPVITAFGSDSISTSQGYYYMTSQGKEKSYGLSDTFVIDGKGFGHGVGLSQYGAQYAAKLGYTYNDIIDTYYPGTQIEKRY